MAKKQRFTIIDDGVLVNYEQMMARGDKRGVADFYHDFPPDKCRFHGFHKRTAIFRVLDQYTIDNSMLKWAIDCGEDIDAPEAGDLRNTPLLHLAWAPVKFGSPSWAARMKFLRELGASLKATDKHRRTVIDVLLQRVSYSMAKSPNFHEIIQGVAEVVDYFLSRGAREPSPTDVAEIFSGGFSNIEKFWFSDIIGYDPLFQVLKSRGMDFKHIMYPFKNLPVKKPNSDLLKDQVKVMFSRYYDPDDTPRKNIEYMAELFDDPTINDIPDIFELIDMLLYHTLDKIIAKDLKVLDVKDNKGYSPLLHAVEMIYKNPPDSNSSARPTILSLAQAATDFTERDRDGISILSYLFIMEEFIIAGRDIFTDDKRYDFLSPDRRGMTPLHYLARYAGPALTKRFLERYHKRIKDINIIDRAGLSPYDYALENESDVLSIWEQYGGESMLEGFYIEYER